MISGSNVVLSRSIARFTVAVSMPAVLPSTFSMIAEQDAQVMPPTAKVASAVAASAAGTGATVRLQATCASADFRLGRSHELAPVSGSSTTTGHASDSGCGASGSGRGLRCGVSRDTARRRDAADGSGSASVAGPIPMRASRAAIAAEAADAAATAGDTSP